MRRGIFALAHLILDNDDTDLYGFARWHHDRTVQSRRNSPDCGFVDAQIAVPDVETVRLDNTIMFQRRPVYNLERRSPSLLSLSCKNT